MDKQKSQSSQDDIRKVFEELAAKAKEINPNLLSDIMSYNETHVAMESYQDYINVLNQPPVLTSSNHVSQ